MKKFFLDWHSKNWPRSSWEKPTSHKPLQRLTHILLTCLVWWHCSARWQVIGCYEHKLNLFRWENKFHAARRKTTKSWKSVQIRNMQVDFPADHVLYYWQLKLLLCAKLSSSQRIIDLRIKLNTSSETLGLLHFEIILITFFNIHQILSM